MDDTPTSKGRGCGKCTLCCKVFRISAIGKPAGTWCPHCAVGKGCTIYEQRPSECRNFYCGYLAWDVLGPHWFPALCKMVVAWEPDARRILVYVDAGRPAAWLEEPYHSEIRNWAAAGAASAAGMHQILVITGERTIVMLPDRDVDLGQVGEAERIIIGRRMTPQGPIYEAMAVPDDDPRLVPPGAAFTTES